MPQSLLPLAYSLVGALLAVAAMWGRNSEQVAALRSAVEKLTAKIETLSALEKADALHSQTIEHLRETIDAQAKEIAAQRERLHTFANELASVRAEIARVSSVPPPLPHVPRPTR